MSISRRQIELAQRRNMLRQERRRQIESIASLRELCQMIADLDDMVDIERRRPPMQSDRQRPAKQLAAVASVRQQRRDAFNSSGGDKHCDDRPDLCFIKPENRSESTHHDNESAKIPKRVT